MKISICLTFICSSLLNLVAKALSPLKHIFLRKTATGMIRTISGLFGQSEIERSVGSPKRSRSRGFLWSENDPAFAIRKNDKGELYMLSVTLIFSYLFVFILTTI